MEKYSFAYTCVYPESTSELDFILDNMKEIKKETLLKSITLNQINESLSYGIKYKSKKQFIKDYSCSAHSLNKKGLNVLIIRNSAIEHIFKKII